MPLGPACSERRLEKVTRYFLGIKGKIWVNCLQADIDEVPRAPLNRIMCNVRDRLREQDATF